MQPVPQPRSDKSLPQRYLNVCQAYLRLNKAYANLDLTYGELQTKFLHLFERCQGMKASLEAAQAEVERLRAENQQLTLELTTTRAEAAAYQAKMEAKMQHLQACYQGVTVLLEQFEVLLHSDSLAVLHETAAAVAADSEILAGIPDEQVAAEVISNYSEQLFFPHPQDRQAALNAALAQLDALQDSPAPNPDLNPEIEEIRTIKALALAP